jgi:hypothetical protein
MEDINKKTLIEALSSLREYSPPESVWDNIDMDMSLEDDNSSIPSAMLHNLPEYDPPESVWNSIESTLHPQQKGRVVGMRWRRTLAIAASLGLLICAYFLIEMEPVNQLEGIAVNYSTEVVDDLLLQKDWKEDEEAFELYKELCDAKKYICEHPEFQVLQSEFDELSGAVEELEYAIGSLGTNADLISQIKEIELERTDVFKKLMIMLI